MLRGILGFVLRVLPLLARPMLLIMGAAIVAPKLFAKVGGGIRSFLGLGGNDDGTMSVKDYYGEVNRHNEEYAGSLKAMNDSRRAELSALKARRKTLSVSEYNDARADIDGRYQRMMKDLGAEHDRFMAQMQQRYDRGGVEGPAVVPQDTGSTVDKALAAPSVDSEGNTLPMSARDAAIKGEAAGTARRWFGRDPVAERSSGAEAVAINEALRHPVVRMKEDVGGRRTDVYYVDGGRKVALGGPGDGSTNANVAVRGTFYPEARNLDDFRVVMTNRQTVEGKVGEGGEQVGYLYKSETAGWIVADRQTLDHMAARKDLVIADGKAQPQRVKTPREGAEVYLSSARTADNRSVLYAANVLEVRKALVREYGSEAKVNDSVIVKPLSEKGDVAIDPRTGVAPTFTRFTVSEDGKMLTDRQVIARRDPASPALAGYDAALAALDARTALLRSGVDGLCEDQVPHQGFMVSRKGETVGIYGGGMLLGTLSFSADANGGKGGVTPSLSAEGKDFRLGDKTLGSVVGGATDFGKLMDSLTSFMMSEGNVAVLQNSVSMQTEMQQQVAQENAQARQLQMGGGLSVSQG